MKRILFLLLLVSALAAPAGAGADRAGDRDDALLFSPLLLTTGHYGGGAV